MEVLTREEIVRLADDCGALLLEGWDVDMLTKFAQRIAAAERDACLQQIGIIVEAEREMCAKVCESLQDWPDGASPYDCAAAIRARS